MFGRVQVRRRLHAIEFASLAAEALPPDVRRAQPAKISIQQSVDERALSPQ
jgi:hypothetical protein